MKKSPLQTRVSTEIIKKENKVEYMYMNIDILNSSQGQNFFYQCPEIRYTENLIDAVLENANNYKMFIVRFDYDNGMLLPIWSPEIVDNQSNVNLCTESITLSVVHDSVTYTQTTNMIYEPETTAILFSNAGLFNDSQNYYYVYTYSHVVYLFNQMLQNCFNSLQQQIGDTFTFTASCPFISYDPNSSLFSLYFDDSIGAEQFNVKFDANLYQMFYSFYFRNNNELVINDNNGLNNITIGSKSWIKITQDFISTSTWSPIQSIVFTTDRMPIISEQNTQPLTFSDNNLNQDTTMYQKYKKIITDIALAVDKSSDYRGLIPYAPNFPRYINFDSSEPLKVIDISLFWKDKNSGNLIPARIPNGGNVSLKLCFQRIIN